MTITAKEAARQRRQLRREMERDLKAKDRQKLAALRAHIRQAKMWRTERLKEITGMCRRARDINRERAKQLRAQARATVNEQIEQARARSRTRCERRKVKARAKAGDAITKASRALSEELAHQKTMRIYEKPPKAAGGGRRNGRTRASELRAESDSEVLGNIPAELAPVFRRVKTKIKASPRRTRTEAFLEWAAENRGDVQRIIDEAIERDIAKLVKEEAELRKQVARPKRFERVPDAALWRQYESYKGAPEVPF